MAKKSKKSKKESKVDKSAPEYQDGLRRATNLALEAWASPWKWSDVSRDVFGDPAKYGRGRGGGATKHFEQFTDGVLNFHSKSGGVEGIGREQIPKVVVLMRWWKLGFLFPPEQRDGLSMEAAELLVKHVDDHEQRGELLAELVASNVLPNIIAVTSLLTRKGLMIAPPETSAFGLNTKRVRSISAAAGRIKLDADIMTGNECDQIAAQLAAARKFIIGVENHLYEKAEATKPEKQRRAA